MKYADISFTILNNRFQHWLGDMNTYNCEEANKERTMSDIDRITIMTTRPFMVDEYRGDPISWSFILIDDTTHETVAAGMIV